MSFDEIFNSISTFIKQNLNIKQFKAQNLKLPSLILLSLLLIAGLFQNCAENGLEIPESLKKLDVCDPPSFTVVADPPAAITSNGTVPTGSTVKLSLQSSSTAPKDELDNSSITWTLPENLTKKDSTLAWATGSESKSYKFGVEAQSKTCALPYKYEFAIKVQKNNDCLPFANLSITGPANGTTTASLTFSVAKQDCWNVTKVEWLVDGNTDTSDIDNNGTFIKNFPTPKDYKITARLFIGTPPANPQTTSELTVKVTSPTNADGGGQAYSWQPKYGDCIGNPGTRTVTYECQVAANKTKAAGYKVILALIHEYNAIE